MKYQQHLMIVIVALTLCHQAFARRSGGAIVRCDVAKLEQRMSVYLDAIKESTNKLEEQYFSIGCVPNKLGQANQLQCDHIAQAHIHSEYEKSYKETLEFLVTENQKYGCPRELIEDIIKKNK